MSEYKEELGKAVADRLEAQFSETQHGTPGLRLSKLGPTCPKALWHSVHTPEQAESLPPWAEIKFSLGHIVEAYALTLAKAAGHKVEGEQDELVLSGIVGHRDAVVDGFIVDVKSTSTRSYQKIKNGEIGLSDTFGYLDQLDAYATATDSSGISVDTSRAFLLAIDKTLGHMCLHEHRTRPEHIRQRVDEFKRVVSRNEPPGCTCQVVAYGSSGNLALDPRASYSPYKWTCFPGLRCFLYSSGPVYLTHVARKPDVPEMGRYGRIDHDSRRETYPTHQDTSFGETTRTGKTFSGEEHGRL
jgi:hypothetical protein